MTEPSIGVASLVAIGVASLGAVAGPYAAIVVCASAGAFWAIRKAKLRSNIEALKLYAMLVVTAIVLTGAMAETVHQVSGIHTHNAVAFVALGIGMVGHRWPVLIQTMWRRLLWVISGKGGPP
jgi:hypothetical protein